MKTTDPVIIQTNHVVRRAIIRVRLLGRSIETMNELYSELHWRRSTRSAMKVKRPVSDHWIKLGL
jgi:hypothetical protein